jgi:uncharacterized protein (DUF302 family)
VGPRRRPKVDEAFAAGEPRVFERESDNDLLSQPGPTAPHFERKPDARQHAIFGRGYHQTQPQSVAQTIDGLRRLIADRGFTVFNVIDHSGVAERVGVQMPDSKLVMFGKPTVGAAVMLAAPLAALDIPLKVLVWEDRNGAVSVSCNSPGFLAERHHLEGALRAPFDAVESIVEALLGA